MKETLEIKVIPNAKSTELIKSETGYKARIAAPPEGGRANEALITLLSKEFNVPKKNIEITRGETARNKVITIER